MAKIYFEQVHGGNDWREVFYGLSEEYYKFIFDIIHQKAIAEAEAHAGVRFYTLAKQNVKKALEYSREFPEMAYTAAGKPGTYQGQTKNFEDGKPLPHGLGIFKSKGLFIGGRWCRGKRRGFSVHEEYHFGMAFHGVFSGLVGPDGRYVWSVSETAIDPTSPYFGGHAGYLSIFDESGPGEPVNWWNRAVSEKELKSIPPDRRGRPLMRLATCPD